MALWLRTVRTRMLVARRLAAFAAASSLGAAAGTDARNLDTQATDNAVLIWNDAALKVIRQTVPGPTITARALAILHTCVFDAWAAYDRTAMPTVRHAEWRRPPMEATRANKTRAISFAAHRALVDLFPIERAFFDRVMMGQGLDPSDGTMDPASPAGVGNAAATAVLDFRHRDGSNQLGDLSPGAYADYTGYQPVNADASTPDPNRWRPLSLLNFPGQAPRTQVCLTPHWGEVVPFAMTAGSALRPAPPARYPSEEFRNQTADIVAISAGLTDFQKVTAEYFGDGPNTEFPPGHWIRFAEFVSRRDRHTLDDDVKMFFALSNALLDASITAWDTKRAFDSVRPVTAVICLYEGQLILAWGGPFQGTHTIRGEDWQPYQSAGSASPPFPEYFSGHSVFSAAAAEILKSFTGSDAFDFSVVIPAGSSTIEPEHVPAADVTLSFPNFSDAADQAGMSRRYGGIHFARGDLSGRWIGRIIGAAVWAKAQAHWDGTAWKGGADFRPPPATSIPAVSH